MERNNLIQILLGALIVGVLGWNIKTTQDLTIQQAVMAAKLEQVVTRSELDSLTKDVLALEQRLLSYEKTILRQQVLIDQLDNRIQSIEDRHKREDNPGH